MKAFQYYTKHTKEFPMFMNLQEEFFECIVGVNGELPNYLALDNTSTLVNRSGIVITQCLFSALLTPQKLFKDFNTFFFFQLIQDINDPNRYNKQYPSELPIDQLNVEHSFKEQLFYEKTAWSDVLKANPDLFIVRNKEEYFIGAKDPNLLSI